MMLRALCLGLALFLSGPASAAEGLDGKGLSFFWALPFIGLLLCIATGPVLFHRLWEHNYGKIAALWAALTVLPLIAFKGTGVAFEAVLHTMLLEYMSFIILLFALFTVAGGILITGNLRGTPAVNTGLLAIGTVLASIVGTTGASMILIRPLIRANDDRRTNVHVVIFFIFLVSNIGGSLTPLGDPPLFLGFLRGVDFFWTTTHLFTETALVAGLLLMLFYAWDTVIHRREDSLPHPKDPTPDRAIKIFGKANFLLLGAIIAAILVSASWKPGIRIAFPGGEIELQNLLRDIILVVIALISLKITPGPVRAGNEFGWGPILEVAKLFAGIFICMIPVLAMLKAGKAGAFGPLVALVSNPDGSPNNIAYFWLTGILSSFLDNAPTYLVFFELAGGDPKTLMGPMALTLAAISSGAVFMGANSYIGNAPNFMVYAIAKDMKVKMPSFFGFILWSGGILVPVFILVTLVFFR
ncbi:MAG: sodium:proton antiporter [Hyphomicrobiales bacterium]|nr:sodium:proton antiporter [Hyphomicrobiales bacterium]MCA1999543.1 sodium:proton antiporter [Hyphomicrobiales bacterium]